jgi:hypothetical protein
MDFDRTAMAPLGKGAEFPLLLFMPPDGSGAFLHY